jgi:translation initiation factor 2 alpha subunit (eIF-2alpha)
MDQKILNQLDIYLKEISTEILNVLTLDDVKYDRVVDVSMKIVNKHKNYQELIKYIEKFKRSDNFNKEKELIMTKWGNLVNISISRALREED